LIAEPSPDRRSGIEFISVLVSGATTIEMPTPDRSTAGRMSIRTSTGGISVAGRARSACQGTEVGGRRAYQS
jgi:hypothetical protein